MVGMEMRITCLIERIYRYVIRWLVCWLVGWLAGWLVVVFAGIGMTMFEPAITASSMFNRSIVEVLLL